MNPNPLCDAAQLRYYHALRWLNLWKVLLYIFGATVVIFLVTAIILFLRETWLPGALTMLGTIVTGTGIAWVVTQKTVAASEEAAAFVELQKACAPTGAGLAAIKEQPWFKELQQRARKAVSFSPPQA